MAKENEIMVEKRGAVTLFDIKGNLTAFSEPFLNEAIENANNQGTSKTLLKFEQSAYINSGGISIPIQLLSKTKKNNQQIGITGLSEHFRKIFNMVGITRFAKIHNIVDEALKSMSELS